jgi:hypothetical protein
MLPQTDPAQLEAEMSRFLAQHPDLPRTAGPTEGRIVIPPDVLSGLTRGFERRMAISGHGILFDAEGRPVELSPDEGVGLQTAMLEALEDEPRAAEGTNKEAFRRLEILIDQLRDARDTPVRRLDEAERFALDNIILRAEAYRLKEERRSEYLWRAEALRFQMSRFWGTEFVRPYDRLNEALIAVIRDILSRTDYMRSCAAAGVPVPPDFVRGGSDWRHQGNLSTNLLAPGALAEVWTWASSASRGGCVALPRGGGLAGIICQGAASGNACFWDNIDRSTGGRIDWTTTPLRIREIEDGNELNQNCTSCHRGNNVFIVSPDDPTWCRLLRGGRPGSGCGPVAGPNSSNFSLRVETLVNPLSVPGTSVRHPRYSPISTQAGWINVATVGCAGTCHLNGSGGGIPSMPPACGFNCN